MFDPPRPKRANAQVAAEPPGPGPVVSVANSREWAVPEMAPTFEDDKKTVFLFDVAVSFSRDGVVDEFRYQRTAGRNFIP